MEENVLLGRSRILSINNMSRCTKCNSLVTNFNKEVNESHKNIHYPDKIEDNMEARLYIPYMEFDMTKICSDIESVYNY